MLSATEHQIATLALMPVAQNSKVGRWRTEAMRSHATPRLLFISKGHGRITVAGLTSGYGPNNLIFIPAHTMYAYDLNPSVFGQMLTIPAAMAAEWPDEATHLRLRDVAQQKEFIGLLDSLERELSSDLEVGKRAAHYRLGLISVFFERQLIANNESTTNQRSETSAARVVAAYTDLIERDYRTDRGVADYAMSLGLTPTHLTRCCNATCGRSALELLTDRRHYEACILLRETKQPVQEIAENLGYGSPAYFSRAFNLKAGCAPSQFRKHGSSKLN